MIDTTVDKPALVDQIIAAIGYRFAIVLLANYPVSCAQLDAPLDLRRTPGRKRGQCEEETGGICWRGTPIAIDSRAGIRGRPHWLLDSVIIFGRSKSC